MDKLTFNSNVNNPQNPLHNQPDSSRTKAHSGIIQSAFADKENRAGLENRQVQYLEAEQALHKIESRDFPTSSIRSSNLKKIARAFAEGKEIIFPKQYEAREVNQTRYLQTGFDPTNKPQVDQWMVFYAKVCVMDADPESSKFHRASPLGKDTFFMNALSKGVGYFKECAKQEGLSNDAVAEAEEIAEVFARVEAKFQRTPLQVREYEDHKQITREVLSIMRSQRHHLEDVVEGEEGVVGYDFEDQNLSVGGEFISHELSNEEYRQSVFDKLRTLLHHPELTDVQAADIAECACSRNLESIMLNAVHKKYVEDAPNKTRDDITVAERFFRPRMSTISVDRYDVVLTSEMHCETTVPPGNTARGFKEDHFTVKIEMRVSKAALFNKTIAEISDQECQVNCLIAKEP